jgi:hypothetical protein
MRFYEFKAPTQPADIKQLIAYAKDPKSNPAIKKTILAFLQKLENKLNSPKNESTEADVLTTAEHNLSPLQRLLMTDPEAKAEYERIMRKMEDDAFELGAQVGREEGSSNTSKIKEIVGKLSQLTNDMKSKLLAICSQEEDVATVIEFLQRCATPDRFIDMNAVISKSSSGNRLPIDTKFNALATRLINELKGSASTHASDGPGEWFLVLTGKNTTKASPGDIAVGNVPVEVKASGITAKGNVTDFSTIKTDVVSARKEFVDTINSFTGNTIFQNAELKDGGISSINTRNLKQLNPIFSDMGEAETRDMFDRMFHLAFGKDYSLVADEVNAVLATVGPDGIDPKSWIPAMKRLAFAYYQEKYKHHALISINSQTLKYTVSLSSEDFVNSPDISMTSLFDFRPRMSAITSFKQA